MKLLLSEGESIVVKVPNVRLRVMKTDHNITILECTSENGEALAHTESITKYIQIQENKWEEK